MEAALVPGVTLATHQRPFRTPVFLNLCGDLSRLYVLIEPEHIAWVVLFFDLHQASIIRTVAPADKLVTRIAQLVYVHSMRELLQTVASSLDPSDGVGPLFGIDPGSRDVYFVAWLTKGKSRVTQTYSANESNPEITELAKYCRPSVRSESRIAAYVRYIVTAWWIPWHIQEDLEASH